MDMKEDRSLDATESEKIPDAFLCCICLDLLYKPVVLVCGHISCFWCVNKSMSFLQESHCPICRHPYYHFPTICQMLHMLLLKMHPDAYERRKSQIMEEEKKMGNFSPQLDAYAFGSHANHLGPSKERETNLCSIPYDTRKEEPITNTWNTSSLHTSSESFEVRETIPVNENCAQDILNETRKQILVSDVMCAICNQLLFRPAVLNCGHVFCEACITLPSEEMLRCFTCQSPEPRGIPKVCLVLNQFLAEQFPKEYALREDTVQLKQHQILGSINAGHQSLPCSSFPTGKKSPWCTKQGSVIHIGVGCDSCGMCPIIGDRYRCKDCMEKIGFDLCGDCYNTPSKQPGRFNQQHTPKHRFEKMTFDMPRLMLGHMGNDVTVSIPGTDTPEGQENEAYTLPGISRLILGYIENESAAITMSNVATEDGENGSSAPLIFADAAENDSSNSAADDNDTAGDQNNNQSTI